VNYNTCQKHWSSQFSIQFGCREIATKQISTLLARNVSRPFSPRFCFSWYKLSFSHLFSTPWLHIERDKSTCRASERILLVGSRQNFLLFCSKLDSTSSSNTWTSSLGAIYITRKNVVYTICRSNLSTVVSWVVERHVLYTLPNITSILPSIPYSRFVAKNIHING